MFGADEVPVEGAPEADGVELATTGAGNALGTDEPQALAADADLAGDGLAPDDVADGAAVEPAQHPGEADRPERGGQGSDADGGDAVAPEGEIESDAAADGGDESAAAADDAGVAAARGGGQDADPAAGLPAGRPEPWPDPHAGGRPAALRIAGLHLRTGQHALARAELEALAGRGRLDETALLDLAEVRWRSGDLSGAGDAANALLARGSEAPLALVIATEAVASAGRPIEARRLASRALAVVEGPLDPLFAGMPRATIWPAVLSPMPTADAPRRRGRRAAAAVGGAPSTAAEAFAGGRAALAKGDASRAALLLGVAMRLEPGFAEDVLRAVVGRDDQPLLALVRGDALRLLGREAEALEAFNRARGRASAAATSPNERSGPGLFDDDPA